MPWWQTWRTSAADSPITFPSMSSLYTKNGVRVAVQGDPVFNSDGENFGGISG
jgi:hypothetical protein